MIFDSCNPHWTTFIGDGIPLWVTIKQCIYCDAAKLRYEVAVQRDSMLNNEEFNVYINGMMWAEEQGLL